jgi:hypothetical protein
MILPDQVNGVLSARGRAASLLAARDHRPHKIPTSHERKSFIEVFKFYWHRVQED